MRDRLLRPFLWVAVPLATLALACMPLLGLRAMVAVIATWLALLTLRTFVDPITIRRGHWQRCLFLALPFLVMLPDMLRASDIATGWEHTERSASLLLFPVGFLLLGAPATGRFRHAMTDLFSAAATAFALFANIAVALTELPASLVAEPGFVYNYRAVFGAVTGMHPPYAAYFFLLAALFQIAGLCRSRKARTWRIMAITILFFAALVLASRMPLLAFIAAAVPVILMRSDRGTAIIPWAVPLLMAGGLAAIAPGIRQRFSEIPDATSSPMTQDEVTSTNVRMLLARSSWEVIRANWAFGTGQANAQSALDDRYRQFDIPLLLDGSYGTHNQPLHWWLCFGITGLFLFVFYFGHLLRNAWRARDAVHLAFLVFLLLCMLTENLLSRQWGVVLFACFNTLFIASRPDAGVTPERRSR